MIIIYCELGILLCCPAYAHGILEETRPRGATPRKKKRNPAPPQKVIMPSASSGVPILPVGEDDASQQRHLKLLQTEMKKVNPNK